MSSSRYRRASRRNPLCLLTYQKHDNIADVSAISVQVPSPRSARLVRLTVGLVLFGASLAMLVEAGLGLDPWDVFHQGVADRLGWRLGVVVVATSLLVLLVWVPLRQQAGVGTIANAVVVGVVTELALAAIPDIEGLGWRWTLLVTGVVVNGFATALYIGAGLGPGPRDGLMTALARGRSVQVVRTCIEAVVLACGWLLGGTVGVGTVLYAIGVGPVIHASMPWCEIDDRELERGSDHEEASCRLA